MFNNYFYILMDRLWQNSLVFRISIWPVIIIGAVVTSLITLVTVSCQSINTAISNPIKSLRYE